MTILRYTHRPQSNTPDSHGHLQKLLLNILLAPIPLQHSRWEQSGGTGLDGFRFPLITIGKRVFSTYQVVPSCSSFALPGVACPLSGLLTQSIILDGEGGKSQ